MSHVVLPEPPPTAAGYRHYDVAQCAEGVW